ncbi:MAG: hypothetical protein AAF902_22990, partial [Chloroflexota bacterium]
MFILFGRLNADEGWYLYASKLVYLGMRPYQDFAYTQTPFLPYIYGIPQILMHGLYTGRITSFILSFLGLILSLAATHNLVGKRGLIVTALLWGTFGYGIYFHSITKTYALTTFLFVFTLYLLSHNSKNMITISLITASVTLASLTRLSAFFFAIPILFYLFFSSNSKAKWVLLLTGLLGAFWLTWLAFPDPEIVFWNLLTHHTSQWEEFTLYLKIQNI